SGIRTDLDLDLDFLFFICPFEIFLDIDSISGKSALRILDD
ncbi:17354_t:CDS:1, partial [Entrophospora sp. SA101]